MTTQKQLLCEHNLRPALNYTNGSTKAEGKVLDKYGREIIRNRLFIVSNLNLIDFI